MTHHRQWPHISDSEYEYLRELEADRERLKVIDVLPTRRALALRIGQLEAALQKIESCPDGHVQEEAYCGCPEAIDSWRKPLDATLTGVGDGGAS